MSTPQQPELPALSDGQLREWLLRLAACVAVDHAVLKLRGIIQAAVLADREERWLPIETAPRDGTVVLLLLRRKGEVMTAMWDDDMGWTDNARGSLWRLDATHWMPPPAGRPGSPNPSAG